MKTRSAISACLAVFIFTASLHGQNSASHNAENIIANIIKQTGTTPIPNTVDVIKVGDPATPVSGIVTTMFATMDVLKKAVALDCNLIIAHEPVFYNHRDETVQFQNDPVFLEKKKYIEKHKLVIWRFHDYIHSLKPDPIDYGMAVKLGWLKYIDGGIPDRFVIPETTLKGLIVYLKKIFPGISFNVVGDPDMKLSHVKFSAGAPGFSSHLALRQDSNTDVVIAGEVPQWETYEYVRDAVSQGRKKAIIFLGHVTSEEPGMEYCVEWLKGFIKDIPVNFVEAKPSYVTY